MFGVLELMRNRNHTQFEEVALSLKGRKRPYLTYDPTELRTPYQVPNTNLYVEVNLDSMSIVRLCERLIIKMGHSAKDLDFEVI